MDNKRTAAILIGALFIIGTVAGGTSAALLDPIRNNPDVLAGVYSHESQIILAAVFWLTMGLALALVPVVAYPVLQQNHKTLAIGYVVFRGGLETVTYILTAVGWLMLLPLRSAYPAGTPDGSFFQSLGTMVFNSYEIGSIGTIVFCLGALMFSAALFRSKLVPRWLSGWGLIAAIPYLAGGGLGLIGLLDPLSPIVTAMDMPLALQEMVLAVWLIGKGFDPVIPRIKEPA
jgi:hypothetical protein